MRRRSAQLYVAKGKKSEAFSPHFLRVKQQQQQQQQHKQRSVRVLLSLESIRL
jgi:hypothetical protein